MSNKNKSTLKKVFILIICVLLSILSLFPFVVMLVNSTRSTTQIQQHAVSLIPSSYLFNNMKILVGKSFSPAVGFGNSLTISICATILTIYFSTMTAYGLVIYEIGRAHV